MLVRTMRDDLCVREPTDVRARLVQGARRVLADERRQRRAARAGVSATIKALPGCPTRASRVG